MKKTEIFREDEMIVISIGGRHAETFYMDSPEQAQNLFNHIKAFAKRPTPTKKVRK